MKNPEKAWAKAVKHAEAGRFKDARRLTKSLLGDRPGNADALFLLGYCERKLGNHKEALKALDGALAAGGGDAQVLFQLGCTWHDLGDFDAAEAFYRRTLEKAPEWAEAWSSLGTAIGSARKSEAIRCQEKALALDPGLDGAAFNLAGLLFDETDLAPARDALLRALDINPGLARVHFDLAVIGWLMGEEGDGAARLEAARAGGFGYLADSLDYMKEKRGPATRFFGNACDTLAHAMGAMTLDGLVLKFGVNFGQSIRFIAALTERPVHGFDSFEGIPEDWGAEGKGAYSTFGALPDVPANVTLHRGWFKDTLPPFAAANEGAIAFANVDCDLYSSTMDMFEALGDRVVAGSILAFDEYLMIEDWRSHEFKAFQEFTAARGLGYEYLAFSLFAKQAVVRFG